VLTNTVEMNLRDIAAAIASDVAPILLQGVSNFKFIHVAITELSLLKVQLRSGRRR
jgi:hypothetical protein